MKAFFKLTHNQWKMLASAFSNISQAGIMFSIAAFFVPETVNLTKEFSHSTASLFLISSLFNLFASVKISERGK